MYRRVITLLTVVLAAAAVTACNDGRAELSPQDAVAGSEVAVVDDRFEPAVLAIEPGDTVVWTWEGNNPHNVVGDDFESAVQRSGTFNHTFEDAGQYTYFCTIHPGMEGIVVVGDE